MNPPHSASLSTGLVALLILAASAGCGDDGSSNSGLITGTPSNNSTNSGTTSTNSGTSTNNGGTSTNGGTTGTNSGTTGGTNSGTTDPNAGQHPDVERIVDREPLTLQNGPSTGSITFEVPDDAVSVSIVMEGADRTSYVIGSWEDDSGNALVTPGWTSSDQGGPALCLGCSNRVSAAAGASAAIAPNNQDAVLNPGTHTITLFGFDIEGFGGTPASGEVEVSVYIKRLPELPEAGVIDMNLHFTGSGGLTATSAAADPEFQAMLGRVDDLYAQIGVRIGNVTYQDIPASYRVIENILQDDSDLQEMFSISAGNDVNAVNLFFVEELAALQAGGGFGLILGIAGGIPGPPLKQGTTRSGVAIAVESHSDPQLPTPAALETTVAHEVGHFLGLFHTSEQDLGFGPQTHDPLDDTPENDDSYLMFNTGSGTRISPWQGRVIRSNPWIRHEN